MRRRARTVTLIAALLASTLTACSSANDLVIYSGRNEQLVGALLDQLEAAVGISVEVRYGGSGEMAAVLTRRHAPQANTARSTRACDACRALEWAQFADLSCVGNHWCAMHPAGRQARHSGAPGSTRVSLGESWCASCVGMRSALCSLCEIFTNVFASG